jgi:hypothetical protein
MYMQTFWQHDRLIKATKDLQILPPKYSEYYTQKLSYLKAPLAFTFPVDTMQSQHCRVLLFLISHFCTLNYGLATFPLYTGVPQVWGHRRMWLFGKI